MPLPSLESLKRIHQNTAQCVESFTQLLSFLRNLYANQEATVRTAHEKMDQFKIGKGIHQGCTLSLCLFNLYAEYIMRKAGLDEAQAGIKIARRCITSDMQMTPPLWQKVKN